MFVAGSVEAESDLCHRGHRGSTELHRVRQGDSDWVWRFLSVASVFLLYLLRDKISGFIGRGKGWG
jgi:hypothetical protein